MAPTVPRLPIRECPTCYGYTPRIAVNSDGDVFLPNAHPFGFTPPTVLVFDAAGTFKSKFGTPGTQPGQISLISGIDIGPDDDVYVADSKRHKILVFDKAGTFLREFGDGGEGPGVFSGDMRGLRIDQANEWLYLVDATQVRSRSSASTAPAGDVGHAGDGSGPVRRRRPRASRCLLTARPCTPPTFPTLV